MKYAITILFSVISTVCLANSPDEVFPSPSAMERGERQEHVLPDAYAQENGAAAKRNNTEAEMSLERDSREAMEQAEQASDPKSQPKPAASPNEPNPQPGGPYRAE